mgnify:CR=1 FL=1
MSDSDGLAGSSSSNGGGVINDAGGAGVGQTTLSGAVEQADKAIRDSAASVVGLSDIEWYLFCDHLSRMLNRLDSFNVTDLDLCLGQGKTAHLSIMRPSKLSGFLRPFHLDMSGAFDPAIGENGDSQEDNGANASQRGLRS